MHRMMFQVSTFFLALFFSFVLIEICNGRCTANDAPVAMSSSVGTHPRTPVQITLQATDANGDALTYIVFAPKHGKLTGAGSVRTYIPNEKFSGTDTIRFYVSDGILTSNSAGVSVHVGNLVPYSSIERPNSIVEGEPVTLMGNITQDLEGDPVSVFWDLGDGSTSSDPNPVHVYSNAGNYKLVLYVSDPYGTHINNGTDINVIAASDHPVARFVMPDFSAYVGIPFQFDATPSSNVVNAITAYEWDFGDGSMAGSGTIVSHAFAQAGPVTVTLKVTDSAGATNSISKVIYVLPAARVGVTAGLNYVVKWFSDYPNDSLTVNAVLDLGDTPLDSIVPVSFKIAGNGYATQFDKKDLYSGISGKKYDKWSFKYDSSGRFAGRMNFTFRSSRDVIGPGFVKAGALPGPDGTAKLKIPFHLEIGGRTFDLLLDTQVTFNKYGNKALGKGQTP